MKKTSLVLAMMLGLIVLLTIIAPISYAMTPEDEALIKKIDGRRYTLAAPKTVWIIDVRGNTFVSGLQNDDPLVPNGYHQLAIFEIQGRETRRRAAPPDGYTKIWITYFTYSISDDGEIITEHRHFSDGDVRDWVYFWQR
jgi:hypothetical protein